MYLDIHIYYVYRLLLMGPGKQEKIQFPEEAVSRARPKQLISLSVDMCFLSLVDPLGLQGPSEESVPRRNSVWVFLVFGWPFGSPGPIRINSSQEKQCLCVSCLWLTLWASRAHQKNQFPEETVSPAKLIRLVSPCCFYMYRYI